MGIKKGLVTYIVTKFSNKAKKWDIGLQGFGGCQIVCYLLIVGNGLCDGVLRG